jgi:penicillin-binding protein 1A
MSILIQLKEDFVGKKKSKSHKLSLYANLVNGRRAKKDAEMRERARYLASLPKHPVKRFLFRMHPKRVLKFWFSRRGLMLVIKTVGTMAIIFAILIGGLFAYFQKDIDSIRPGELAKNVQSTVTTYLDRNGNVLWEDKGIGNYKRVVESESISQLVKNATVAIEDKDFYNHSGVSIVGITRAFFNNVSGGSTQGGSTLTQQLVKQVFFADEAAQRGAAGIPRKIKEMILSIEVERMYNKDQILTLYLNESPYGGRRNGVESGAQTYFGVSAKDLTLPQAALLASIPQNPSLYDPYNVFGHESLLARQHQTLDNMAEQGFISKDEAEEAKKFPIIDSIVPESTQYKDIKAPHFVQMARDEIKTTLGTATVGKGGLVVTTSLDIRIQNKLEEAMNDMFNSKTPTWAGFSNGAATVEDVKTGQIVALMGSRDFNYPGYGQDNASTAYIQPGSTIKPLVFTELFEQKLEGQINYGSGTILRDENIDTIYGAKLQNADKTFKGDITIRSGLATSRNVSAVKAMYISGVETALDTIHELGATSYCTQGNETQVGLASAIGGCGIKQVDLVSAYSSLARMGAYKPQSTVLEVKNNSDEVIYKWTDPASEQIIDAQSAYIVTDILHDDIARSPLTGRNVVGMSISGVPTSTKTGTSDKDGKAKDIWMSSYSPVLSMAVWLGNSDATILRNGTSLIPGPIVAKVMEYAHKDVYSLDGRWALNDWFGRPDGIQVVNNELYPSWWRKDQGQTDSTLVFDKVSKFKATACTPDSAKIELGVKKFIDPITKKDAYSSPEGYDSTKDDNIHSCADTKPSISASWKLISKNSYQIDATIAEGTFPAQSVEVYVGGISLGSVSAPGPYTFTYTVSETQSDSLDVTASVTDTGLYRESYSIISPIPAYQP